MENKKPDKNNSASDSKASASRRNSGKDQSKQDHKSGSRKKKAKSNKKQSFKASWRSASPVRRLEIVFLGCTAAIGLAYVGVAIWQNIQAKQIAENSHKPLVVHPRPPTFQSIRCSPNDGVHTGNIVIHYKNIGDETADVTPPYGMPTIVPEKPPDRFMNGRIVIHDSDCGSRGIFKPLPLEPGIEKDVEIRQSAGSIPADVKFGDLVQLQFPVCTSYQDRKGNHHGTCDLYRLGVFTKDLAPIDKDTGTPSIPCDGVEYTGKFTEIDHCQK